MPSSKAPEPPMILMMGLTGAGKSYFINQLVPDACEEGETLKSKTAVCAVVEAHIGESIVAMVDCPGFDDTQRKDGEVLDIIGELLATQYLTHRKVLGVIYLHRISDIRWGGSARKALEMFRAVVGDHALTNVVLASTRWDQVDREQASSREQELRNDFWSELLDNGAQTNRFRGDRASAEAIIAQLLGKRDIVLRMQRELVDENRTLRDTAAGSVLDPALHSIVADDETKLRFVRQELTSGRIGAASHRMRLEDREADIEANIEQGRSSQQKMDGKPGSRIRERLRNIDWQAGLRTALAVLSTTLTVVGFLVN